MTRSWWPRPSSPLQRWTLWIASVVLLMGLAIRWIALPLRAHWLERQAIWQDLRVKITDANLVLPKLPQETQRLEELRARYEKLLQARLGDRQSLAHLLEMVKQQAQAHRLELTVVQSQSEAKSSQPLTLSPTLIFVGEPLTLKVTGRYRQLGEFLGDLSAAPYLGTVQHLTVKRRAPTSAELDGELLLIVYRRAETTQEPQAPSS